MKTPLIPRLKIAILAIVAAPIVNVVVAGELVTFQYDVYPTFIQIDGDPAPNLKVDNTESLAERTQRILEVSGITFGDGASAKFDPVSNTLTVTNLPKQIELVDALLQTLDAPFEAKFDFNKRAVQRER